jgi:hypothetical protein
MPRRAWIDATAVEVPCKQYLLYFVEFLRDVGIDASAQLQEIAGQVLFSVTPKDKDEALDNIREALGVYLELPIKQVIVATNSPETSIEVQRLGSQILHLQSQIMLGNAVGQQKELALRQKDLIIQQQQSIIQQQLLTGQVLIQSLQRETESNDAEPVIGDIIKVKRWNPENIPVDFDLPEVIRRLKEKFSRKQLP